MKANERRGSALSDIRLMFYPKSITFNHAKDSSYRLYLEKNVQVINQITEIIKIRTKLATYNFAKDESVKPFRITSDKFCSYQISLYQLQPNGEETFKDSAEFTLNKFIRHYFEEYQKMDEQVKAKEKSSIAEHWRALSNNFTRKTYSNTVKFKQADAIFEFACIPETDYDQLVREDDIRRQKKREMEERNRKPGEFTKSKTLPALKLESRFSGSYKKYHENDSDIGKLHIDAILDEQTRKEMTQSLKKFSVKLPEALKSPRETETSSSNQTSNGLPTKSKINTDRESLLTRQILIAESIDEQIEDIDAAKADGNEESLTVEGKVPIIQIKNFHSCENPQLYNVSARLGTLSLNSIMNKSNKSQKKIETKSNTRQNVVTSIWILLNIFLVVYLMHPLPRV